MKWKLFGTLVFSLFPLAAFSDTPGQVINKVCPSHQWINSIVPGQPPTCLQPGYSDLSGTAPAAVWGSIVGTLSNQTDLQSALNAKQNTGNYITALTGDVSASGPGSVAATVNSVGGSSASAINSGVILANAATSTLVNNTIVKRDSGGNIGVAHVIGALVGNADTASGLAALPSACPSGQYASGILANGNAICSAVTDAQLSTSDITTNNVSISKHGFAPKLPNDATKYLDGTGSYTVPSGGGGGGSPGGANTAIQFNNSGVFGGSPDFQYAGSGTDVDLLSGKLSVLGDGAVTNLNGAFVANNGSLATGTITFVSGNLFNEGENWTVTNNPFGPATYKYFVSFNGTVYGGGVTLNITTGDSAQTIRDAFAASWNSLSQGFYIPLTNLGTTGVTLNSLTADPSWNVAITETVANAGFVVTGMSGAVASDNHTNYVYAVTSLVGASEGAGVYFSFNADEAANNLSPGLYYNTLTWNAVPQATSYNIYRAGTDGTQTIGLIGNTASLTFVDDGQTATPQVIPILDPAALIESSGTITAPLMAANTLLLNGAVNDGVTTLQSNGAGSFEPTTYSAPQPPSVPIFTQNTGSGSYVCNGQTINYVMWGLNIYHGVAFWSTPTNSSFTDPINDGTTVFNLTLDWTGSPAASVWALQTDSGAGTYSWTETASPFVDQGNNLGQTGMPTPGLSSATFAGFFDANIFVNGDLYGPQISTINNELTVGGYLNLAQQTTPSPSITGRDLLYFKSDDNLYATNSVGTEIPINSTPNLWASTGGGAIEPVNTSNRVLLGGISDDFSSTLQIAGNTFASQMTTTNGANSSEAFGFSTAASGGFAQTLFGYNINPAGLNYLAIFGYGLSPQLDFTTWLGNIGTQNSVSGAAETVVGYGHVTNNGGNRLFGDSNNGNGDDILIGRNNIGGGNSIIIADAAVTTSAGQIILGGAGFRTLLGTTSGSTDDTVATLQISGFVGMYQQSTPSTFPMPGEDFLYFKSDDNLYAINSSGTEIQINGGGGPALWTESAGTLFPTTSSDRLLLNGITDDGSSALQVSGQMAITGSIIGANSNNADLTGATVAGISGALVRAGAGEAGGINAGQGGTVEFFGSSGASNAAGASVVATGGDNGTFGGSGIGGAVLASGGAGALGENSAYFLMTGGGAGGPGTGGTFSMLSGSDAGTDGQSQVSCTTPSVGTDSNIIIQAGQTYGTGMVQITGRTLIQGATDDGTSSLQILGNQYLSGSMVDSTLIGSVDPNNRNLDDPIGGVAVDWNNGYLNDSSSVIAMNWHSRITEDGFGAASLNWNSRNLIANDGTTTVLDWSSPTQVSTAVNMDAASYSTAGTAGLSGTYTFNAITSGNVTSMTFNGGILTAVTTLP